MASTAEPPKPLESCNSFAMPRTLFITGCSTGFGRKRVQILLDEGEKVVATARNSSNLSFRSTNCGNYPALTLDVTSNADINSALAVAL